MSAIAREQFQHLPGIRVLASQDFGAQPNDLNPLGYKDGIDQPSIEGSGMEPPPGRRRPIRRASSFSVIRVSRRSTADAAAGHPRPQWHLRRAFASISRASVPSIDSSTRMDTRMEERELLAAKLVGRWRSGAPLTLAPDADNPALGADPRRNNDFNYANDRRGLQVPLGSHIRRMNPRDTELARLTDVNVHRHHHGGARRMEPPMIRTHYRQKRMTKCRAAPPSCSSAPRRWPPSNSFSKSGSTTATSLKAGNERDPIVGLQQDGATFTIPKQPVRRRVHGIDTFNRLRGGEYFSMPSLSALNWLANPSA